MKRALCFWDPFDGRRVDVAMLHDSGEVEEVPHNLVGAEAALAAHTIAIASVDTSWRRLPEGRGFAGPQMLVGAWQ